MSTESKKNMEEAPETPLEESLDRLEAIVEKLESGEADLEKSIDLYIEGRDLGRKALKRLDAIERKIQIVTRDDGEDLQTEDFQ